VKSVIYALRVGSRDHLRNVKHQFDSDRLNTREIFAAYSTRENFNLYIYFIEITNGVSHQRRPFQVNGIYLLEKWILYPQKAKIRPAIGATMVLNVMGCCE
jgi:hypothetical protein